MANKISAPGQRERLELVCRYALRPPVAGDRLRVTGDGQVQLTNSVESRWSGWFSLLPADHDLSIYWVILEAPPGFEALQPLFGQCGRVRVSANFSLRDAMRCYGFHVAGPTRK